MSAEDMCFGLHRTRSRLPRASSTKWMISQASRCDAGGRRKEEGGASD